MPPSGLSAVYFEADAMQPPPNTLSDGLRQFGEGLLLVESKGGDIFLKMAADVAEAQAVIAEQSVCANVRAQLALRHLPQMILVRLDAAQCAAEIYKALLYEREAIRVADQQNASENYSRIGDVLTFMSKQPDIVACIAAHRTIGDAYSLAAAPAPCLHFRHHTTSNQCWFRSALAVSESFF